MCGYSKQSIDISPIPEQYIKTIPDQCFFPEYRAHKKTLFLSSLSRGGVINGESLRWQYFYFYDVYRHHHRHILIDNLPSQTLPNSVNTLTYVAISFGLWNIIKAIYTKSNIYFTNNKKCAL